MATHPLVDDVVGSYLAMVDAEAPGLVEGLYLEGSVALGDFRPHASDVDFVAVTASPPDTAALHRVHARLRERHPRPFLDGIYLTWDDLAHEPASAVGRPTCHESHLRSPGAAGKCNPVLWHTVARHAVACRGPATFDVWTDPAALAAWQHDNLDRYWTRWVSKASRLVSRGGLFSLTGDAVVWVVTGVSRLHYTLATGEITSKDGAGRHALRVFPDRWHRVVDESLRIRRAEPGRSLYRNPLARRQDALAFATMVIADAHRRYPVRT